MKGSAKSETLESINKLSKSENGQIWNKNSFLQNEANKSFGINKSSEFQALRRMNKTQSVDN
jgi:ABC-type polar amino acid transport system ATPase subunit